MSNPNFFKLEGFEVEPDLLRWDVEDILKRYPSDCIDYPDWTYYRYARISLVHEPGMTDPMEKVYKCGHQVPRVTQPTKAESDYSVFNEEFEGMYVHTVYQRLERWIGRKLGRVRIMRMEPHARYQVHQDFGPRYHIATHTDEGCVLVCSRYEGPELIDPTVEHIPADGSCWFLEPLAAHYVDNNTDVIRYHLLFNEAYDL